MLNKPSAKESEPSYTLVSRYSTTSLLPAPTTIPQGMASPFPPVNPTDPTEIFTTSFSPSSGMLQASFWKKLNSRLDVAAELQTLTTPNRNGRREGIASVGFRLQTVFSVVRGMIDTMGRVSGVAEYTIAPGLMFSISGEIDYAKASSEGSGRVGLGFSLEA